ncbi:CoB--CoM heterodisulfide reductase iron-sulfur subunit B family protein [Candidatus Solincola sp.]|nr:CoB--CoM heterodisulfide reductase iron-sulfur subunit B family protein [Actinomycetota bacterium]MDI7253241.1 CoB--CoM heterodisulfide reductase iron-sulfur subunit B family protein [Actinomycetota bacterium]
MRTYSYYPGCSQLSSAEEYGDSAVKVAGALGVRLEPLPDWSCCGASSAHMTNHLLSVALPARDLAQARELGKDLVVVCAACYHNLRSAREELLQDEALASRVEEIIGSDPRFRGRIVHLLDVIYEEVGLEALRERVVNPLRGLKPVSYYGCLMARPRGMMEGDNPDHPTRMDELLSALGAEVKPWSYKTDCCGGSLSLTRTDLVVGLVNRLFEAAEEAGADSLVTACPMCLANLEMRQREGRLRFGHEHDLPVFFFTELIGLALGMEEAEGWLSKHLLDPRPLLWRTGIPTGG